MAKGNKGQPSNGGNGGSKQQGGGTQKPTAGWPAKTNDKSPSGTGRDNNPPKQK